jgi:hypothetical protein
VQDKPRNLRGLPITPEGDFFSNEKALQVKAGALLEAVRGRLATLFENG